MNLRDTAERLVWTVVAAFFGTVSGSNVLSLDLSLVDAAGLSAVTAGANFVTIVARTRLAVLPSPGDGLRKV